MRAIFTLLILLGLGVLSGDVCVSGAEPIRVLILSGQNNHAWEKTTPQLKKTLEDTGRFKASITERPDLMTASELEPYAVIVSNWNAFGTKKGGPGEWSQEAKDAYLNFVRSGKGHVVVHAGGSSFNDWEAYQKMIGGASWKGGKTNHGPQHLFEVRTAKLKIVSSNKTHPICEGLDNFTIHDELWNDAGLDKDALVIAEGFSSKEHSGSGRWEPVAAVNKFGEGRNFTLLLGHDATGMTNPGFVALFVRGTEWAAKGREFVPFPVAQKKKGEKYPYRMLLSDKISNEIQVVEKDGSVSWKYPLPGGPMQGEMLPNGNVLFSYYAKDLSGVREVNRKGEAVFDFQVEGECHAVKRLADGNTLVGFSLEKKILIVNPMGKIVSTIPVDSGEGSLHMVMRRCNETPQGTLLVSHPSRNAIVEYDRDGKELKVFAVDGMAHFGTRLANGNTLVAGGNGHCVVEFAPDGSKVWEFLAEDFPQDTNLEWIVDAQRLPNGNTLIGNWLGHKRNGEGISILEVTPDKKVVWTMSEKRIVNFVQILK